MTNIIVFGTKSKKLRVTIRRSNYPQVEVTVGSPAYMQLPNDLRKLCGEKCEEYLAALYAEYNSNVLLDASD